MNFVFYLHDETSLQNFEQKLLWFRKHYRLVSNKDVEEHLYNGLPLRNSCHITVDDGWLSTYRIIFPVIKKYNIPITIFVSPHISQTGENRSRFTSSQESFLFPAPPLHASVRKSD